MVVADDPGEFLDQQGVWSFTYGPIMELPFADAGVWLDLDLPVAGEDAYPFVAWFNSDRQIHRPTAKRLAYLEGLLRALAAVTEAHLDRGRWAMIVSTFDGPAEDSLSGSQDCSIAGDQPAASTRHRFDSSSCRLPAWPGTASARRSAFRSHKNAGCRRD